MKPVEQPVRCASLNLAGLRDGWDQRREAAIRGLSPLGLDLICFQEATVRGHGAIYRQAFELGSALGLPYGAFAPYGNAIEVMSDERGGLAIASRWPIRYSENLRLPEGSSEATDNRVALVATVMAPGGDLDVVTVHLSWRESEAEMRLVQLGIVLDYMGHAGMCQPGARTLLAGDFNAVEREPVVELARERLVDAYRDRNPTDPGHTWVKTNPLTGDWPQPDRRLDYMFIPPGAHVDEARIVLDQPAYASDHFGLFAAIAFPQAASAKAA